jgi:hypothetical protein
MICISEDGADSFLFPQRLDKRLSQWREFQQPKTATLTHNTIGAVCVSVVRDGRSVYTVYTKPIVYTCIHKLSAAAIHWVVSVVMVCWAPKWRRKGKDRECWCSESTNWNRIFSLVPTAASAERNWASHGFIHSKDRNRLASTKVDKLVYLFCNSKMDQSTSSYSTVQESLAMEHMDPTDAEIEEAIINLADEDSSDNHSTDTDEDWMRRELR